MKTKEKPTEEIIAQDESALLRHFVFVAIFRNFLKSSHRYLTQSYDDFGKGWEEDFYAGREAPGNETDRPLAESSADEASEPSQQPTESLPPMPRAR